jgi:hypothetical protein
MEDGWIDACCLDIVKRNSRDNRIFRILVTIEKFAEFVRQIDALSSETEWLKFRFVPHSDFDTFFVCQLPVSVASPNQPPEAKRVRNFDYCT